ncbi:MAG: alpha/beta hydrolase [Candidatus Omnitrophica bacterium]|nr:alpha/beta hydrolase [Candidatus Omnitrophota bacterium]
MEKIDSDSSAGAIHNEQVLISQGGLGLSGDLCVPLKAKSIIIFAHGSGSSRLSPRNRLVSSILNKYNFATLLFDLLSEKEEKEDAITGELRFNIDLLSQRLMAATDWALNENKTKFLKPAYFGASTGAAAALVCAAKKGAAIGALVSRGGRPDLAEKYLAKVKSPTLLIVGGNDTLVIKINNEALGQINAEKELAIVKGAGHLFEEQGALEEVAKLAAGWFRRHL